MKFFHNIFQINVIEKWQNLSSYLGWIEDLDLESTEVAKVEISKHFGELIQMIPTKF